MLRAVEQLNVRETAVSLNIPEATVKTRFHRARNMLQENLNEHMHSIETHAFEFAGERCDSIVRAVLSHIRPK